MDKVYPPLVCNTLPIRRRVPVVKILEGENFTSEVDPYAFGSPC